MLILLAGQEVHFSLIHPSRQARDHHTDVQCTLDLKLQETREEKSARKQRLILGRIIVHLLDLTCKMVFDMNQAVRFDGIIIDPV